MYVGETSALKTEKTTTKDCFDAVVGYLLQMDAYKEASMILDYALCSRNQIDLSQVEDIWDYQVDAFVNTGGSEGVYVDLRLKPHRRDDDIIALGTWKTLGEGPDAYAKMGAIAGLLTYAVEVWMYKSLN